MDGVIELVNLMRGKSVDLWVEGDRLLYRAPRGVLTQDVAEKLRSSKGQIIELLTRTDVPLPTSNDHANQLPVSFAQRYHYQINRLNERLSCRSVASAIRLLGPLNVDLLGSCLTEIVRRHAALRMRMIGRDETLAQILDHNRDYDLKFGDLTTLPVAFREAELTWLLEHHVLRPVDITADPLVEVRLFRLHENEHVLLVAMEHMISDALSRNILIRDLLSTYTYRSLQRTPRLPPVGCQFPEYVLRQSSNLGPWREARIRYWTDHLYGCPRVSLPADRSPARSAGHSWNSALFRFGTELKAALCRWCRSRGTTPPMAAFAVYAALVLRWCGVRDMVMHYQISGRDDPKLENTIGYLASVLYLRVQLYDDDSFMDLITRLTSEYCRAHEHADSYYLCAQTPRPAFTQNTGFNWVPMQSESALCPTEDAATALTFQPVHFTVRASSDVEVDEEPSAVFFDHHDDIVGSMHFATDRFSEETMHRFWRNFALLMNAAIADPHRRIADLATQLS